MSAHSTPLCRCVTFHQKTFHLTRLFHSILTPNHNPNPNANPNTNSDPNHSSAVAVACFKKKGREMSYDELSGPPLVSATRVCTHCTHAVLNKIHHKPVELSIHADTADKPSHYRPLFYWALFACLWWESLKLWALGLDSQNVSICSPGCCKCFLYMASV